MSYGDQMLTGLLIVATVIAVTLGVLLDKAGYVADRLDRLIEICEEGDDDDDSTE
jgi:hypothetical protein